MEIKMSVTAPSVLTLAIPGTANASTGILSIAAPFSGKVVGAYLAVTTAPAGSALTANLNVDGSTAVQFSIAAGSYSDEGTVDTGDVVNFSKGELITLDVTGVGSGTAGSNVAATVLVECVVDGLDRNDAAFVVTPATSGHDHRFGQPANDDDFHDPELGV
jgi:hypothetical protein